MVWSLQGTMRSHRTTYNKVIKHCLTAKGWKTLFLKILSCFIFFTLETYIVSQINQKLVQNHYKLLYLKWLVHIFACCGYSLKPVNLSYGLRSSQWKSQDSLLCHWWNTFTINLNKMIVPLSSLLRLRLYFQHTYNILIRLTLTTLMK